MSYTIGNASICLVEFSSGAVTATGYRSRLDMVLAALDDGGIGDGYHGSDAHNSALATVIAKANQVLTAIHDPPVRCCNRHTDCDAADAKAREKGFYLEDHCCKDCFGS